jgi:hypothetical protein
MLLPHKISAHILRAFSGVQSWLLCSLECDSALAQYALHVSAGQAAGFDQFGKGYVGPFRADFRNDVSFALAACFPLLWRAGLILEFGRLSSLVRVEFGDILSHLPRKISILRGLQFFKGK